MNAEVPVPSKERNAGDVHRDREAYRERPSVLPGAVIWTRTEGERAVRVLPDGCMDIIWASGPDGDELIVAGPDTRAHLAPHRPGTRYTGLRMAPGQGPAVLGVPACELRDLRVPLSDLWPSGRVRALAERAGATDPARALEAVAGARWRSAAPPGSGLAAIVADLGRGTPVAEAARNAGVSERRLHRRCLEAFGYGPKMLARILRMNLALDLARSGAPLAESAVRAGYADQPHLTREVRALTGVPPGLLLG